MAGKGWPGELTSTININILTAGETITTLLNLLFKVPFLHRLNLLFKVPFLCSLVASELLLINEPCF